jgi:hypothetical protein
MRASYVLFDWLVARGFGVYVQDQNMEPGWG